LPPSLETRSLCVSEGNPSTGEGEADIRFDGSLHRQDHALVANTVAWRQHRLIFNDATITDMAAEFNRYNPSVLLRPQGLESDVHRFNGSFEATDPKALQRCHRKNLTW
jgi:ferric-dicitrate binding protein FerR (iron transport regulator)